MRFLQSLITCLTATIGCFTHAQETNVIIAAASNFRDTLTTLTSQYEQTQAQSSSSDINISFGSTGKLIAQIERGAPYDIFLSADIITGRLDETLLVAGTEFTYAYGRLALVHASTPDLPASLNLDSIEHLSCLAIANPRFAPYGRAAENVASQLRKQEVEIEKQIFGQSVAQAFQFVEKGACEYGLVAFAQVKTRGTHLPHTLIPTDYHPPIRQNAVLLKRAETNLQAREFLEFLQSAEARKIIASAGYTLDQE